MQYPERESKTLDFKSKLPNMKSLIKTCIAYANGIGGEIIIGVEDKTRSIVGIDDNVRQRIYEEFPNALYDNTQPSLIPKIYEKLIDKKSVLIIKITPTNRKPCFLKSHGIPGGVYCRVGSHTKKATEYHIEELMREARNQYFDVEPITADIKILNRDLLKVFYGQKTISKKRLLNDKIVSNAPANQEQLVPSVAGTLMFADNPHDYLPEAQIICTRFIGTEGRDILQTEDIYGSILDQANTSLKLVMSWLKREYQLFGAQLKAKTIIPETAVREAINNALLHRKYNIPGPTKIALFDDRLEIFNPGQFPGLVDINNLGDGTTFLRNPTLVRLARQLGLVEKLGSGIRLIIEECLKAELHQPIYSERGDFVKVVFPFKPAVITGSTQAELILALFRFKSEITIDDVMTQLKSSRNTATRHLNQLIEKGKIFRTGKGPSVRYYLK